MNSFANETIASKLRCSELIIIVYQNQLHTLSRAASELLQKIQKRRWNDDIVEKVDEQLRNLRQLIQTGRDTLWDNVRHNVLEAWNITNINKKRLESYDV